MLPAFHQAPDCYHDLIFAVSCFSPSASLLPCSDFRRLLDSRQHTFYFSSFQLDDIADILRSLLSLLSHVSASPSSLHVTCHCRYVQDSAPPFVLSLPLSANATDLLDTVLGHAGLSKDKLECANFRVAYKLFSPLEREGPIADFVHPHTDASIEAFFVRVPENDSGEKVLDVSIFSEDRNIFEKTIPNMVWSPPESLVEALDDDPPPPNNFQCLFVHKDTNHRFPMSLPATLTGRQLKEKIRISSFYEVSVPASENDPSLPAMVSDESLDVEVQIAGSSRSPGLKCKLLDAWPLRAAVLAIADDTFFMTRSLLFLQFGATIIQLQCLTRIRVVVIDGQFWCP